MLGQQFLQRLCIRRRAAIDQQQFACQWLATTIFAAPPWTSERRPASGVSESCVDASATFGSSAARGKPPATAAPNARICLRL